MTLRLWRAADEAETLREQRDQLRELEQQEREDAEHRVVYDPWEELGGEAA